MMEKVKATMSVISATQLRARSPIYNPLSMGGPKIMEGPN